MSSNPRSEAVVEAVIFAWLDERGWEVHTGPRNGADLLARRGTERVTVEVKGHTGSTGTDVDTLMGQILRRIDPDDDSTTYAVALPETLAHVIGRVDPRVLARLDVAVWLVDDFGQVRVLGA